ncbi:MAG: hypothetical protein M9916_05855 [Crocinitomicaceae bacterium]|nr:hypothetical protein [Crocinitomicaceae bacterium]
MTDNIDNYEERDRKPPFLVVIAVLSLVNIAWSLINNVSALFRGPMSPDEIDDYKIEISKSISSVQDEGIGWAEGILNSAMNMIESINIHHTLNLVTSTIILLIGAAAVLMMLRGRKIGFHGYIIYSFLASTQIYLFVAPSILSNAIVIFSLLASGLFVLLYGLNLKWMK